MQLKFHLFHIVHVHTQYTAYRVYIMCSVTVHAVLLASLHWVASAYFSNSVNIPGLECSEVNHFTWNLELFSGFGWGMTETLNLGTIAHQGHISTWSKGKAMPVNLVAISSEQAKCKTPKKRFSLSKNQWTCLVRFYYMYFVLISVNSLLDRVP